MSKQENLKLAPSRIHACAALMSGLPFANGAPKLTHDIPALLASGLDPENDIFIPLMKLKNTLRCTRGEDPITHLGLEYYN